jgi:uncharacterized protein (TIGR03435 family)
MNRSNFAVLLLLAAPALQAADAPTRPPVFEAASIKTGASGSAWKIRTTPGTLIMENVPLPASIRWAYQIRDYQLRAPAWLDDARYAIVARTSAPAAPAEMKALFQRLLTERFGFKAHFEEQMQQGYAMLVDKSGSKMRESASSAPPALRMNGFTFVGQNMTVNGLCDMISRQIVRAPVLDATDLQGKYDFSVNLLAYAGEAAISLPVGDMVGMLNKVLQKKLGLRLQARKVPVQVLVVDRAEKAPIER